MPKLANRKKILDKRDLPFECDIETQNFRPPEEKELTFSGYGYQGTEVMGLDLATGKVTNYSKAPGQYDEPEGIFPDGKHTLVECDKHIRKGSQYNDLYKLALDGSGHTERLTPSTIIPATRPPIPWSATTAGSWPSSSPRSATPPASAAACSSWTSTATRRRRSFRPDRETACRRSACTEYLLRMDRAEKYLTALDIAA